MQLSTTFSLAESIISKDNERLESESARVKNVAVLSELPRNKKSYVQDGLSVLTYSWYNQILMS